MPGERLPSAITLKGRAKAKGEQLLCPIQQVDPGQPWIDWPITPEALYWGPRFIYEQYQLPIIITENGMANCDWVHADSHVHGPQRIDFLTRYLQVYGRAIGNGVDARGYFLWSIIDNFEWAFG